jgi:integrase
VKYRKQGGRDRAFVEFEGKRYYLPGPFGSPQSREAYRQFVQNNQPVLELDRPSRVTIAVLANLHRKHADRYYPTGHQSEAENFRYSLAYLLKKHPTLPVDDFGPLKLKALMQEMAVSGLSRIYINAVAWRIKRLFRWGVSEEMVDPGTLQALLAVPGLRAGRTPAKESSPRQPVPWEVVEPALKHMQPAVKAMVLTQWYTGARPQSVCAATADQFTRGENPWLWRPLSKTRHLGKELLLFVGPKCQEVLDPFLKKKGHIFRPQGGSFFSVSVYRQAVTRAVERAKVPYWFPYQLRHAKATSVRASHGIEAAQVTLGHAKADVTQIYAKPQMELARRVALETG